MRKFQLLICVVLTFLACKKQKNSDMEHFVPVQEEEVAAGIPVPAAYPGYELVWSDEFSQASLNQDKWNYETGTGVNGDFGTGQLDRATDRPDNVNVLRGIKDTDGGALAISTRKERYQDRNYTSGRIHTKGKFACGAGYRIEARIWARDVKYKGQGFAFWMMPDEIPNDYTQLMWPQGGEIDIMEYVGAIPNHNLGSVHYAWFWENNEWRDWNHGHKGGYFSFAERQTPIVNPTYGGWPVPATAPNTGSGAYHLYRVDWFTDRIEFSVDEQVYHINYFNDGASTGTAADGQDQSGLLSIAGKRVTVSEYSHHFQEWKPFDHQFYLILSAGVGGNDNQSYGGSIVSDAVFPCSVFIDWVRVFKRK
ncbi:MAG: glycoside hydrolase family 16 protein [Pedobacter sp.]|nr:MAG: glycoside hydrolase family 16 protein [Pedobacter sp.]